MTEEQQREAELVRDPAAIARETIALTILRGRIDNRITDLRSEVADWTPGVIQPVTLPNPDNPRRPFKVGTVRCDQGRVAAKIDDAEAFEAWAREHSPQNVVIEAAHLSGSNVPPPGLLDDLQAAFQAALSAESGPFPIQPCEALWRALRKRWTVERAEWVEERIYVQPGYVEAVLQLSKDAEEPCAPGGVIPAGVVVDTAPAHAYVQPTKDSAIADGFIDTLRRDQLAALAAGLLPTDLQES